MPAIITTEMHTNDITVIDKFLILFIAFVISSLSLFSVSTNLAHNDYIHLEKEVREGRFVLSDINRLMPYASHADHSKSPCYLQLRETAAVLAMYLSELVAVIDGVNSLSDQGSLNVQIQRAQAMSRVREVLVCNPLDGDMWFRLSLLAFIMKMDNSITTAFLAWSKRTAPHEAWIKNPRDQFSQIYRDPR